VLLTLRHLKRLPAASQYWVSEAGVFFKGDVSLWVHRVQSTCPTEDLLPAPQKARPDWPHRKDDPLYQPALLRDGAKRWWMTRTHVRRLSSRLRLLDAVFTILSLDVYIYGEALAPSVCVNAKLLNCQEITNSSTGRGAIEWPALIGWPDDVGSKSENGRILRSCG